jgi:ClpP class serine protease
MKLAKDVEKAHKSKDEFSAVAFVINSPGGSPVYSSMMGNKVLHFAKDKQLPYYTFAEDVAASGGYWLLCTGDKAFANQSSVVGSIGVISP